MGGRWGITLVDNMWYEVKKQNGVAAELIKGVNEEAD
jgi:hypothetical protein